MDYKKINLYKRLRDFFVPLAVLDEIFQNDNDIKVLKEAYDALLKDGFSEDGAAEKILSLIHI